MPIGTIKDVIFKFLEKNKEKTGYNEITENYLLPETANNLYELAKVNTTVPGLPGKKVNIFDIVYLFSPDDFEVGNFHFPFLTVKFDYSSFNKVESEIITSNNKDMVFFKKIYQAFKIVEDRKDLIKFKSHDYKIFHEAITMVFNHEDLQNFIENPN